MDPIDYVGKIESGSVKEPNIQKLLEPLHNSDSVINVFCTKCGGIIEATLAGAEKLATTAGSDENFTGKYFSISSCIFCSPGENPKVELKNIIPN